MRLLLKLEHDDGYESLLPFIYESKQKAIEDLQAAYDKTFAAVTAFQRMYAEVCAPREALYAQRRQYTLGNSPKELDDAIAAEMKKTDLRNFDRPSEKVEFAGLDLTLHSFATYHDGHRNIYMPAIMTVDEFFADVE